MVRYQQSTSCSKDNKTRMNKGLFAAMELTVGAYQRPNLRYPSVAKSPLFDLDPAQKQYTWGLRECQIEQLHSGLRSYGHISLFIYHQ